MKNFCPFRKVRGRSVRTQGEKSGFLEVPKTQIETSQKTDLRGVLHVPVDGDVWELPDKAF